MEEKHDMRNQPDGDGNGREKRTASLFTNNKVQAGAKEDEVSFLAVRIEKLQKRELSNTHTHKRHMEELQQGRMK